MTTLLRFSMLPIALLGLSAMVHAQWCVPTTIIPYDADMPGITHFVLNTIDRTSSDLEHYPLNNYTYTGMSTTLVKGATYPVTIGFTIDALICPNMNLRVWADLNQDGQLDDAGETLLSVNHRLPNSYTGTITIPMDAHSGTTRLRVTAKMSDAGGHTLPTPCDQPADLLGYHGEMEDYDVNIVDADGIEEHASALRNAEVYPMPITAASMLRFDLAQHASVRIEAFDALGRRTGTVQEMELASGEHMLALADLGIQLAPTSCLRITTGNSVQVIRMISAQ